jgi:hypothetical protein
MFFLGMYIQSQSQTATIQPAQSVSPTVAFVVSPTPDQTATWKTYTGSSEYSFKYPSDWTLKTSATPDGRTDVVLTFITKTKEYSFKVTQGASGGPQADKSEDQNVEYGGKKFIRRTWMTANKPIFVSVIPEKDTIFNHIEIALPSESNDKYLQLFNQILSTFNFTK